MGHLTLYPGLCHVADGRSDSAGYLYRLFRPCQAFGRSSRRQDRHFENCRKPAGAGAERDHLRPASPLTVTTIEFCQIKFVEADNFMRSLESDSQLALTCATLLAREVNGTFETFTICCLARSSTEKLARLLLSWVAEEPRNRELRVPRNLHTRKSRR